MALPYSFFMPSQLCITSLQSLGEQKKFLCNTTQQYSKMHLISKPSLETILVPLFTKIHYQNYATALLLTLCYASFLCSPDVEI